MKLYFLGTGGGLPSLYRNVSSLALILQEPQQQIWLFDCGEATQHQLLASPLRPSKITHLFISHLHGDHIFGLPGLLSSLSSQSRKQPLAIYAPAGLKDFLHIALDRSQTHLRYPLDIHEINDGETLNLSSFQISIRQLEHGIPSYGFRLQEPERPGTLDAKRLQALGIPPGPLYRELKQGKCIKLDDGRTMDGKAFLGPPKPGRTLAILGDTRPTESAIELAHKADVLVHEATFAHEKADHAKEYFHSTTVQAAKIALQAQAKALILTHLSARYRLADHIALLKEAEQIFQPVYIAKDHWSYSVTKHEKN
jgi:ribonuclease Z